MSTINVAQTLAESKLTKYHFSLVFWFWFIIVIDGYDLIVFGTVVNSLMNDWSLTTTQAGLLGSITYIGVMIGTILLGILGDKIGRKQVAIWSFVVFCLLTGVAGFSNSPVIFGTLRFLAGLALGGVIPNIAALSTIYFPKKYRNVLLCMIQVANPIGGMIAAFIAIPIIPEFGWRMMFYIGFIPLITLPFLIKYLPESPEIYYRSNQSKLANVLSKIQSSNIQNENVQFQLGFPKKEKTKIKRLFEDKRMLTTLLFWFAFILSQLVMYGLNTWLPNLMRTAGYTTASGLLFLGLMNLGAVLGGLVGGFLADRTSGRKVNIIFGLIAASMIALLAIPMNLPLVSLIIIVSGFAAIGMQLVGNSYVTLYYPTNLRASGLGFASGFGRIGAMLGPSLGGMLLALNLPFQLNFLLFAIPAVLFSILYYFVQEKYAYSSSNEQEDMQEIENEQLVEVKI
ncbi:MFS transporter [Lysinibacillus yapensis]|nr:aromatic acid/H+ symport family MFS transporter [Lysinibacillus yapensis]